MSDEKYLYCFIKCPEKREFTVDGMGDTGNRVYTINYLDLAAIVSDSPEGREYKINKENATRHELVLGAILKDFSLLPVGFGCVADNVEQIKERILQANYDEILRLLNQMDKKVELTLKALWKDNQIIRRQVLKTDPGIKNRLGKMTSTSKMDLSQVIFSSAKLGERLVQAIDKVKTRETDKILASIKDVALDMRLKKLYGPLMIFNAAFLVDRAKEEEFDRAVDELDQRHGKDIKFIYTGPLAPYSFIDFRIALG